MLIELRKGMILHPCTFNAVIAPEKVMISALNGNIDLQRFLFLYVSGNYSRLLSSINRSSKNFEVRRAFTAHQLFTILKEVSHTILLFEHDPTLFDGADEMIPRLLGC
jgi:DNA polymerase I